MKIKKYVVSNMQEAINQIKEDLGPDAVIVSSHKAPKENIWDLFNPGKLIVTAAVEEYKQQVLPPQIELKQIDTKTEIKSDAQITTKIKRTQPLPDKSPLIPLSVSPKNLPEPALDIKENSNKAWFNYLVNNMIEQQEEMKMKMNQVIKWKKILAEMEIAPRIVDRLLSEIQTGSEQETEELFKLSLKNNIIQLVNNAYDNIQSQKIFAFIGPTGVGKTTTLVKLATKYKVFNNKNIALIALYSHRFGAVEELNYYAEMIGVPVEIVMTPGELAKAVKKHQEKDYIFIDTEGRPSKNASQILELKIFLDAIEVPKDVILVLSSTTKNRDIMRIADDFSRVGYSKLIFTKLDETDTLGTILNVICDNGIPVSYVTSGQNIPDDILAINPKKLANLIFGVFERSENYEL